MSKVSAEKLVRIAREANGSAAHRHARAGVLHRDGATGPGGESADLEIAVSTEGLARDGGVVPLGAWELEAFRRNPVVMLDHRGEFPIGRALWTEPDRRIGELRAGWRFHEENEESRLAAKLYAKGYMRTASVGFRLLESHRPNQQEAGELRDALGLDEDQEILWVADRAELLEQSAVSVPSDPDALADLGRALSSARAHGIDVAPLDRHLQRLRRRCRSGDAAACRRLRKRRRREGGGREVERVRVHGLPARVVREPDGTRLLVLPVGDDERAVELRDDETPEDALSELLTSAARQALRRRQRQELAEARAGVRP